MARRSMAGNQARVRPRASRVCWRHALVEDGAGHDARHAKDASLPISAYPHLGTRWAAMLGGPHRGTDMLLA